MSLSHHFQQQRKADAVTATQARVNNKEAIISTQPQSKPSSSPPPQIIAVIAAASTSSSSSSSSTTDLKSLARAARVGTIGWETESDSEVLLRKFDMQLAFGPSTGLSREARWQRAKSLGLNPPVYILDILTDTFAESNSSSSAKSSKQPLAIAKSGVETPRFVKGTGSFSLFHTGVLGTR